MYQIEKAKAAIIPISINPNTKLQIEKGKFLLLLLRYFIRLIKNPLVKFIHKYKNYILVLYDYQWK